MDKDFSDDAWADYLWALTRDKVLLKKINRKLKSIDRNGYSAEGHIENLKNRPGGWRSVTLDQKNRLVFRIHDGKLQISQCRGHYWVTWLGMRLWKLFHKEQSWLLARFRAYPLNLHTLK